MQNGTVHYYEIQKKTKKGKKYQNQKKVKLLQVRQYVNTVVYCTQDVNYVNYVNI